MTDEGNLEIKTHEDDVITVRPEGSNHHTTKKQVSWADLKVGPVIGKGNQATVRKAKHMRTGARYALKCFDLKSNLPTLKSTLQMELSRLVAPEHPNLVSCHDAYLNNNKVKVLMDYMNMGTVSDLISQQGPMPQDILAKVVMQVLNGLICLHETGIVHRDLKPANLLIDREGLVKIADFGVSMAMVQQDQALTHVGSAAYMSPERIRGDEQGIASDIWSLGLTCAECALGIFPFAIASVNLSAYLTGDPFSRTMNMFALSISVADEIAGIDFDVLQCAVAKQHPYWPSPEISTECREFVAICIQREPRCRPPCPTLLNHAFIINTPSEVDFQRWIKYQQSVN